MKQILDNSGIRVEVNALFLQPTYSCIGCNNEKDCYVKAHKQSDHQTCLHEQYKLLEWFALFPNHTHANQITVSLDTLPPIGQRLAIHRDMRRQFAYLVKLTNMKMRSSQLHITTHSPTTLIDYGSVGGNIHKTIEKFDMISFSSWNGGGFLKTISEHAKVNFNHLCPVVVNSSTIKKQIEYIVEVGRLVNSIYMMARKCPVGLTSSLEQEEKNASRLQQDMSYIKTIIDKVPEDVRRKIYIDTCIEDVVKHSRRGFGCSAGISKFQIWPDGTVSGCPYAYRGTGTIARSAEDILENIRLARSNYDFEKCHLRRSHHYLSR